MRRPWDGLGGAGVVHGVYWIQFCIANANLHELRAGRNAPPFPCDACGSTRSSRLTPRCGQGRQHADPGRQTRARCVRRAALGRRASNSASPSSLGRAPIQPDSPISKSTPRSLEFQYPVVVLNIERARYKIVTPGESSATKGCSRHGFVLALRCWHRSCSTRPF